MKRNSYYWIGTATTFLLLYAVGVSQVSGGAESVIQPPPVTVKVPAPPTPTTTPTPKATPTDSELAKVYQWLDEITRTNKGIVTINLGDRGGTGDGDIQGLYLLHFGLLKYPKATRFIVQWEYSVALGVHLFTGTYDRSSKSYSRIYRRMGTNNNGKIIFRNVNDVVIHDAARNDGSLEHLDKYGAKQS